jgi:hypothetical protein
VQVVFRIKFRLITHWVTQTVMSTSNLHIVIVIVYNLSGKGLLFLIIYIIIRQCSRLLRPSIFLRMFFAVDVKIEGLLRPWDVTIMWHGKLVITDIFTLPSVIQFQIKIILFQVLYIKNRILLKIELIFIYFTSFRVVYYFAHARHYSTNSIK